MNGDPRYHNLRDEPEGPPILGVVIIGWAFGVVTLLMLWMAA